MSFYDTGLPVPSNDPRDLDDNAKHIDECVNSTLATWTDRTGQQRITLKEMETNFAAITVIPVNKGGTGATTVVAARSALQAARTGQDNGFGIVANPHFLSEGALVTFSTSSATLAYVDAVAAGVPANCPAQRVGVFTKLAATTLVTAPLPLKNGATFWRVAPGQRVDCTVWMNVTGGAALAAALVFVESAADGTFIANNRLIRYDNSLLGWQKLTVSYTAGAGVYRIVPGIWSETSMPIGGVIYFGEPIFTPRSGTLEIAATRGVNADITSMTTLTSITSAVTLSLPNRVAQYTLATLPSAATYNAHEIDVTNATGGPKRCRSNGTVWQILNTTTTVS